MVLTLVECKYCLELLGLWIKSRELKYVVGGFTDRRGVFKMQVGLGLVMAVVCSKRLLYEVHPSKILSIFLIS